VVEPVFLFDLAKADPVLGALLEPHKLDMGERAYVGGERGGVAHRELTRSPVTKCTRTRAVLISAERQRRWNGDTVLPTTALRLAGKTVPAPGSDVDVLAPRSTHALSSSSA
jgi:hypothetical protein